MEMNFDKRRSKLAQHDTKINDFLNQGFPIIRIYEYFKNEKIINCTYSGFWRYIQRLKKRNINNSAIKHSKIFNNDKEQIQPVYDHSIDKSKECQENQNRKALGRAILESIASKPKHTVHEIDED